MSKATNPSFKEQLREHFSCNFVYPENLMNWEILNLNAMFNWFYASCYLLSYITILLTLIKKTEYLLGLYGINSQQNLLKIIAKLITQALYVTKTLMKNMYKRKLFHIVGKINER